MQPRIHERREHPTPRACARWIRNSSGKMNSPGGSGESESDLHLAPGFPSLHRVRGNEATQAPSSFRAVGAVRGRRAGVQVLHLFGVGAWRASMAVARSCSADGGWKPKARPEADGGTSAAATWFANPLVDDAKPPALAGDAGGIDRRPSLKAGDASPT